MRHAIIILLSLMLLFGCTGPAKEPLANYSAPGNQNLTNMSGATTGTGSNASVSPGADQSSESQASNTSHYDFSKIYTDDGKLIVYSFYSSKCLVCKSMEPFMEELGRKYANKTEWRGFDIVFQRDRDIYFQFFQEYNISQTRSGTPTVMVNGTILWGKYEINDSLEKIINDSVR